MADTCWSRADRAAAALQAHVDEAGTDHYGDEGSEEFDEAIVSLLVDLKHLLWRVYGPDMGLEDLTAKAVDQWAVEADALPEGGDEDDD